MDAAHWAQRWMKGKMMTNRMALEEQAIAVAAKSLRKDSKFYAEDLAAIKAGVKRKTDAELQTTISRQNAINNVSVAEIRRHQQF